MKLLLGLFTALLLMAPAALAGSDSNGKAQGLEHRVTALENGIFQVYDDNGFGKHVGELLGMAHPPWVPNVVVGEPQPADIIRHVNDQGDCVNPVHVPPVGWVPFLFSGNHPEPNTGGQKDAPHRAGRVDRRELACHRQQGKAESSLACLQQQSPCSLANRQGSEQVEPHTAFVLDSVSVGGRRHQRGSHFDLKQGIIPSNANANHSQSYLNDLGQSNRIRLINIHEPTLTAR